MANSTLTKFSLMTAAIGTAWIIGGIPGTAQAGTIAGSNSTPGLFDASSGTRTITFTGAEAGFDTGIIQDVNVSINFARWNDPTSSRGPYFNEMVFRLISPTGTTVSLIEPNSFNLGRRGTQFSGRITFDDATTDVVNVNRNLPQAGVFRPVSPLSVLNGENAAGTWTLFIEDTLAWNALQFRDVELNIQTQPVPTPALLPGLIGLGLGIWRKRKAETAASANET
jgi:hypothetical protein